jgi:hypothetical protein
MKSEPDPRMTLGNAAKAELRLIVWCHRCKRHLEPDPAVLVERHDADTPVLDRCERLVCSKCGGREYRYRREREPSGERHGHERDGQLDGLRENSAATRCPLKDDRPDPDDPVLSDVRQPAYRSAGTWDDTYLERCLELKLTSVASQYENSATGRQLG